MFSRKERSPEQFLSKDFFPRIERFVKTPPSDLVKSVVREETKNSRLRNPLLSVCGAIIVEGDVLEQMYKELKPNNLGDFNVAKFYTLPIAFLVVTELTRQGKDSSEIFKRLDIDPAQQAVVMTQGILVLARLTTLLREDNNAGFKALEFLMGERSFLRRHAPHEFRLMELSTERYKTIYSAVFGNPKSQS